MSSDRKTPSDLPVLRVSHREDWAAWLDENHAASPGVWLKLSKKASGTNSMTYAEALEIALCYGWIDGQKQSGGASDWFQKFTPRTKRSIWSKLNRKKALELIESGRMRAAGLREVERAKNDGRWQAAYDSPGTATVPPDFEAALDKNHRAKAFFATLDSRNRYGVLFRIQTVKKSETRAKRIEQFVQMLERNEKVHP